MSPIAATIELAPTDRDFTSGLLVTIVSALRGSGPGDLIAFTTARPLDDEVDRWSRFTGNAVVGITDGPDGRRYVVRNGPPPRAGDERPIGSRLWLYTNFDCNLACTYCCARSSPTTPRRELGLERVRRIAREAKALAVDELFITGGEPFLLADIGAIVAACADSARTTVLTNGMLFLGKRREALEAMPRDRVVFQVSLDSATPELHDRFRGEGTWAKAWRGVAVAREAGFRVRLAATVSGDAEAETFNAFLDREGFAEGDRVVRHVALRGFAHHGVALARADLAPEPAITSQGVYWHPVGADDDDFFVTSEIFPLAGALGAVKLAYAEERKFGSALASIFNCA